MVGTDNGCGGEEIVAGLADVVVGGVGALVVFCAAARFSWEIFRNFEINFRTG